LKNNLSDYRLLKKRKDLLEGLKLTDIVTMDDLEKHPIIRSSGVTKRQICACLNASHPNNMDDRKWHNRVLMALAAISGQPVKQAANGKGAILGIPTLT
jgi:hypothetical protein